MQRIAILGSTGSIGVNALDIARQFPDEFSVVALSAHASTDSLSGQVREFKPRFVCVTDDHAARGFKARLPGGVKLFSGPAGLAQMVSQAGIDKVVVAISGAAALPAVWQALESGKALALANKEALVMAGPLIMRAACRARVQVIPIDSEQSAIWQCLQGQDIHSLKNIYLTASGGPLRGMPKKDLRTVTLKRVLAHPRWRMGKKITVDSATLMNKGLEVIEAMFLFGVSCGRVKVVVHPESIIHSMVEFFDGVVMAQLSVTDMRIPIQYALSYPKRLPNKLDPVDFCALGGLHFEAPDTGRFPCLRLAYEAAQALGTAPAVLNAANEVAVGAFLKKKTGFTGIPAVIEKVLARHRNRETFSLDDVYAADSWAREEALRVLNQS